MLPRLPSCEESSWSFLFGPRFLKCEKSTITVPRRNRNVRDGTVTGPWAAVTTWAVKRPRRVQLHFDFRVQQLEIRKKLQ